MTRVGVQATPTAEILYSNIGHSRVNSNSGGNSKFEGSNIARDASNSLAAVGTPATTE
jgi:hypothetical protein